MGGKPIQQEDQIMFNRSAVITACGALLGLVVAAATVATLSASPRSNRLEYLTFSGPVGLPDGRGGVPRLHEAGGAAEGHGQQSIDTIG
jgi:hypothetical protein